MTITEHHRQVLVEHALASNRTERGWPAEAQYEDVIADLSAGRPVADRALLTRFLWRRVTVAIQAGLSPKDHRAWSAAVQVLDQLGESLDDIFIGRAHGRTPMSDSLRPPPEKSSQDSRRIGR